MTKSELFKAAHKLAKSVIQGGDNYRVTFGLAIKAILSQTTNSIVDTLLAMGLKVWENYGKKRIYMNADRFNEVTGYCWRLSDSSNKFFYDFETDAIMRVAPHTGAWIETWIIGLDGL